MTRPWGGGSERSVQAWMKGHGAADAYASPGWDLASGLPQAEAAQHRGTLPLLRLWEEAVWEHCSLSPCRQLAFYDIK